MCYRSYIVHPLTCMWPFHGTFMKLSECFFVAYGNDYMKVNDNKSIVIILKICCNYVLY